MLQPKLSDFESAHRKRKLRKRQVKPALRVVHITALNNAYLDGAIEGLGQSIAQIRELMRQSCRTKGKFPTQRCKLGY